jgi:hypothetical protein
MSAREGGRARAGIKEIDGTVDPSPMSTDHAAVGPGDAGRRRWPPIRPPRPTGIRNGGLLLLLVAAAGLLALVDQPDGPGLARRLPFVAQHLPPPVGIMQSPPAVQPAPGAGGGEAVVRGHPRRAHPRPVEAGAVSARATSALTASRGRGEAGRLARSGSGGTGSGSGGSGSGSGSGGSTPASPPPVTTAPAPAAASVQVQVPPVRVRVGITPSTSATGQPQQTVQLETRDASIGVNVSVPRVTLLGR